jgi:hypothetical protein
VSFDVTLYVPAGKKTGQPFVIAVPIVVLMAEVESAAPDGSAPLQVTSIHGRPEHICTSLVKILGACAYAVPTRSDVMMKANILINSTPEKKF